MRRSGNGVRQGISSINAKVVVDFLAVDVDVVHAQAVVIDRRDVKVSPSVGVGVFGGVGADDPGEEDRHLGTAFRRAAAAHDSNACVPAHGCVGVGVAGSLTRRSFSSIVDLPAMSLEIAGVHVGDHVVDEFLQNRTVDCGDGICL